MISLNMEGDTTGSQSLGKRGSVPLSTTFLSNIQRLNDSLGGSIPGDAQKKGLFNKIQKPSSSDKDYHTKFCLIN